MYVPRAFAVDDIKILHQQMQASPLPVLVTHASQGLLASHVPMLLNPDEGPCGTLYGHLARANPHWQELSALTECLVIFRGPDGYVTPSWYPSKAAAGKVVPTWNYSIVEARGKPAVCSDAAWLGRQLADLTDQQERGRPAPWSVGDAPADYVARQTQAIVGIEIPIERIDGKFKLSQNRNDADRLGVRAGMADGGDPHGNPALARLFEDEAG